MTTFERTKCIEIAIKTTAGLSTKPAGILIENAEIYREFCKDDFNAKYTALEIVISMLTDPLEPAECVRQAAVIYGYIHGGCETHTVRGTKISAMGEWLRG